LALALGPRVSLSSLLISGGCLGVRLSRAREVALDCALDWLRSPPGLLTTRRLMMEEGNHEA